MIHIRTLLYGLTGAVLGCFPSFAQAPVPPRYQGLPIDKILEIGPALRSCWRPTPEITAAEPMELTLRFSFKRNGDLLARPQITFAKMQKDKAEARAFVASVLAALDACLPLPFTDRLGAAFAGRPYTLRFISKPKSKEYRI